MASTIVAAIWQPLEPESLLDLESPIVPMAFGWTNSISGVCLLEVPPLCPARNAMGKPNQLVQGLQLELVLTQLGEVYLGLVGRSIPC